MPRQMLKFVGTVPIVYRGATYHIPLTIWIPSSYPFVQPNIYVTPTPDMAIRPRHPHVDSEGKCYLPALSQWNNLHSNLSAVVGELQGAFAVKPPVYAKPKGQDAVQPPPNPYNSVSQNPPPNRDPPVSFSSPSAAASSSSLSPRSSRVRAEVTNKVQKECAELAEELAGLMGTQKALEQGSLEIEEAAGKMREHRRQLQMAIDWTQSATQDVDAWLASRKEHQNDQTDIVVDEIVVPTSAVGAQLLAAVAANKAIEDTMYQLNKAMYSDEVDIDCETFTKEMRKLASAQYMELALIQKIHSGGPIQ